MNNGEAHHHIRPPQGSVFADGLNAPNIFSPLPRFTNELGGGRRIAKAQIQSLGADRRKYVIRLANQHHALAAELRRYQPAHGKCASRPGLRYKSHLSVDCPLDFAGKIFFRQRHQAGNSRRAIHPNERRPLPRQRNRG